MKRYRFRLEQVRRIRRIQEDLAAAGLGLARREEADAHRAEQARHESIAGRARPAGAYLGGALLAERTVWEAELHSLRAAGADRVRAELTTADRRAEWHVASQRVQALDLLDERRREEHRLEADRTEAARVDDLVASRFHRRAEEGAR